MQLKTKKIIGKFMITVTIIAGLIGIRNVTTQEVKADTKETVVNYVVDKGDTLYDIAKQYKADKQDIRELIYRIQKDNNIKNNIIRENQILKINLNKN